MQEQLAWRSFRLEIVNKFPVLSISVGDQKIPLALDLGGDEPIQLSTQALEKINVEILPDVYTPGRTPRGTSSRHVNSGSLNFGSAD
jgi:hypothetical protein